ncbi:peptide MFS transporter [Mesoterricola silvestris]|uniref:MFS transporter n=1 Tax=Mesoterricola silvestris TaxID=2927979 RepID=A0AA48K927_9BACT|nr:peptide MFS transporter [Mesoterricola silvestris]BDU72981.1 MFS transporter [Mesoterricola silvestris]
MSGDLRTDAPAPPKGQPAGLWVLIFTEAWERWSHYGMRAILILYLTAPVALGGLGMDKPQAAGIFGGYLLAIYLFALSGGQIADRFLGAKRTIVLGGLLIASGQLLLQVRSLNGLVASLVLISIGTCLLKPNVSASVGRLYTKEDPRRDGAFTFEYMGINLGAMIAPIFCGYMAEQPTFIAFLTRLGLHSPSGWSWAFGLSGFGMLLGLVNFVLRRNLIVDVNLPEGQKEAEPRGLGFLVILLLVLLASAWMVIGGRNWPIQLLGGAAASVGTMAAVSWLLRKGIVQGRAAATTATGEAVATPSLTPEDFKRLGVVGMMLCFSMTFWAVFQQAGSSLNLFAKEFTQRVVFGFEIPASWFQSVNAVGIVLLGSVFAWLWTRRAGKWPSSPVKFALALLFAALGFYLLVPASLIAQAVPGQVTKVGMGWLGGVYLMHTIGELCLSPVGLSYVSKLAPKHMSSQLMGAWFFATGLGSYLAGKAAGLMGTIPLAVLFGFCATVALAASLILWVLVSPIIRRQMGGHS